MKLSSIHIGERSRRAMTGIESLAASIEKVGPCALAIEDSGPTPVVRDQASTGPRAR